MLGKKSN